jgi:hypothetical protein
MANEVVQRGIVGRALAALGFAADGSQSTPAGLRVGRYGEGYAMPVFPDMGVPADEGTYFCVNNNQTGLATAASPQSFSATNPFLLIYNRDAQPNGKRIYLDYAMIIASAAGGGGGTSVQVAVTIDAGNRYSSGGTEITSSIANPNLDASGGSVARVFGGNVTAAAASTSVRTIVGDRALKGAIAAALDSYLLKFGAVDNHMLTSSNGTLYTSMQGLPKIVVGPNESALIHLWCPAQTAASTFYPEMGWIER